MARGWGKTIYDPHPRPKQETPVEYLKRKEREKKGKRKRLWK
jgi:hypothetical protein